MAKIIRTPTRAEGGITPAEKTAMDAIAAEWIAIAMRTDPIDPEKITPAILSLYAAADLPPPRNGVIIVPSPLVMAFAYGAAATILDSIATDSATDSATFSATVIATDRATRIATDNATDSATRRATRIATDNATDNATRNATESATESATASATGAAAACFALAGDAGLSRAKKWWEAYQGGNMWAAFPSYVAACRDVLGLRLPEFAKWQAWEDSARHGGFRVMHPDFCMVCDFPELLRVDADNQPHCEDGPSHRWRDGWSLYHWHGTAVPEAWIMDKASVSPKDILGHDDANVRAAGIQIFGWDRLMSELDAVVVDRHPEGMHGGELLAVKKSRIEPRERGTLKLLRAECPRNGIICFRVPDDINTAHAAQAWSRGLPPEIFQLPSIRT